MKLLKSTFGRSLKPGLSARFRPVAILLLAFVLSCSANINKDLRNEYNEAVRGLGLTPVYPPKEEFQVGDVYFYSYDTNAPEDLELSRSTWVATLSSVREAGNDYLKTRINFRSTGSDFAGNQSGQSDLSSGSVTLNEAARRTLPLVSFPSVSAAASTAGSLGGYGFARSFGIGFGSSEQVSVDFHDTRAFGVPIGSVNVLPKAERGLIDMVCSGGSAFRSPAILYNTLNRFSPDVQPDFLALCQGSTDVRGCADEKIVDHWCNREGRECGYYVVTRTIITRKMSFSYSSAKIAELALAKADNLGDEPDKTVPVTSTFDINITLGPDSDAKQIEALQAALKSAVSAGAQDAESSGLRFAGIQGNRMVFEREFVKPVTIAYEGFNWTIDDLQAKGGLCNP
jgi:hypothetical protein